MKSLIAAAFGAAMLTSVPHAAKAELVDMSTLTCAQLMALEQADATFFLAWMDGWLAGQADNTTIEVDDLEAQIEEIVGICTDSPELGAMTAAKQAVEE